MFRGRRDKQERQTSAHSTGRVQARSVMPTLQHAKENNSLVAGAFEVVLKGVDVGESIYIHVYGAYCMWHTVLAGRMWEQ